MLILTDSHSRQADTPAREMGVWRFNAKMFGGMDEEHEDHVWQEGEGLREVWAAPLILTSRQRWVIEKLQFLCPHLKVGNVL